MRIIFSLLSAVLIFISPAEAQVPKIFDGPLNSTAERTYLVAEASKQPFFNTPADVQKNTHLLRLVVENENIKINKTQSHLYLLPFAADHLERAASEFVRETRGVCGRMGINSLTRDLVHQRRLSNGPVNGSEKSTHLRGMAYDVRIINLTPFCLSTLQRVFERDELSGLIDATQETGSPHFHVVVFPPDFPFGRRREKLPVPIFASTFFPYGNVTLCDF